MDIMYRQYENPNFTDHSTYTSSIEIDESYANKETDIWGAAFAWTQSGYDGVEYNLCIDETGNHSAIYYTTYSAEKDYMETDYSRFCHYEIDFSDKDWSKKLCDKMFSSLDGFLAENIAHEISNGSIVVIPPEELDAYNKTPEPVIPEKSKSI